MQQNELYHSGVKGMRWGHKKTPRSADSFNTKYRHTMTDTNDKLIGEVKPINVTRSQRIKAEIIAKKEENEYYKLYGDKANEKDALSVRGNKYDSEIAKYQQSPDHDISKNPSKVINVGASVTVGLLAGGLGSAAVFSLSGSETFARMVAPSLAVVGGLKYYEWLNS